jgi:glycosyltransferase involved in cell wall biosynthesis
MSRISCIIPAWNEADRIGAVLAAVANHPDLAEVIIIDDGSTDGTAGVAEEFIVKSGNFRLIRQPKNAGKTAALAAGIAAAQEDFLMFLDADLIGLGALDIAALARPVLRGEARASISLRGNAPALWRWIGLDYISGERVLPRALLAGREAELLCLPRFGFEVHLNQLWLEAACPIAVVQWPGVRSPLKAHKAGLWRGMLGDLCMMRDIFRLLPPHRALVQISRMRAARVLGEAA